MTSERVTGVEIPDQVATPSAEALLVECFERDYPSLRHLAYLMLGDRDLAEDVVQEVFLRTFSSWRRVRQPERAGAYLRAGVVNMCRSKIRRRYVEARGNEAACRPATSWQDQTADAGAATWMAAAVLEAVRTLPPRQRAAVVLRYYADLGEAEIALAMHCAPGTVKSQLSKARATLAVRLAVVAGEPTRNAGTSSD